MWGSRAPGAELEAAAVAVPADLQSEKRVRGRAVPLPMFLFRARGLPGGAAHHTTPRVDDSGTTACSVVVQIVYQLSGQR
nr:unnamed protein product [Digitaria exilis]